VVDGVEVAGEPRVLEKRPVPGHPELVYSATATPNPDDLAREGGPLEYRVDVEIAWSNQGARQARRFSTLLLREVPFGERLRRRFVEDLVPEAAPAAAPERPARTEKP
jgi:hypothetical protein